jgi:hypothetical protein
VPIRISFNPVSALARDDSAATAAVPSDSFRNSRRFIAISDDHARALRAITRCQDDGAAQEECRVLRENSNDNTAKLVSGDGFIAETRSDAPHFSFFEFAPRGFVDHEMGSGTRLYSHDRKRDSAQIL